MITITTSFRNLIVLAKEWAKKQLLRYIQGARMFSRYYFLHVVAQLRGRFGIPIEDLIAVGVSAQEAWEAGYSRKAFNRLKYTVDRTAARIVESDEPYELLSAASGAF